MEAVQQALERIEGLLSRRVEPRLLTCEQAGAYIGRSKHAVEILIGKRELPVVRVGHRVHLDKCDLDAWIERNKC